MQFQPLKLQKWCPLATVEGAWLTIGTVPSLAEGSQCIKQLLLNNPSRRQEHYRVEA